MELVVNAGLGRLQPFREINIQAVYLSGYNIWTKKMMELEKNTHGQD